VNLPRQSIRVLAPWTIQDGLFPNILGILEQTLPEMDLL
jgi:hypothetical protein